MSGLLAPGAPAASQGGWLAKSANIKHLTADTFESVVNDPNHTVFVEFFAPWCGHCKHAAPELDKFADKVASDATLKGNVVVAAIDADTFGEALAAKGISIDGFPTMKVFQPASKVPAALQGKEGQYKGISDWGSKHMKVFTFDLGKGVTATKGDMAAAMEKFASTPQDYAKAPPDVLIPEKVVGKLLADAQCKPLATKLVTHSAVVSKVGMVDKILADANCGKYLGDSVTVLKQIHTNDGITKSVEKPFFDKKVAELKAKYAAKAPPAKFLDDVGNVVDDADHADDGAVYVTTTVPTTATSSPPAATTTTTTAPSTTTTTTTTTTTAATPPVKHVPVEISGKSAADVKAAFNAAVGEGNKDVLVVYHANWCHHCKDFLYGSHFGYKGASTEANSDFQKLIAQLDAGGHMYDNVKIVTIDMAQPNGAASKVATQDNIRGYPTIKFFKALSAVKVAKVKAAFASKGAASTNNALKATKAVYEPSSRSADFLKSFVDQHCASCKPGFKALDSDSQAVAEGAAHHGDADHADGQHAGDDGTAAYAYDGAAAAADEALLGADGAEDGQVEELSLYDNSTAVHPEIKAPIEGMDEAGNEFI